MTNNLDEHSIIKSFFTPLATNKIASQDLKDDVAKISLKSSEELIISTDTIVEDVHFKLKDGAFKIAAKLLLTNLSDIAASGAKPLYYTLNFSKNNNVDENFVKEFADSLKEIQNKFKISLIGGDIVRSNSKLFFSITIFAAAKKNSILSRKNAQDKDVIFVSGNIGDAFIGLQLSNEVKNKFSETEKKYFLSRHFFPTPRINLAQELVRLKLSNCAIDVSDGLLADLKQICDAANLSATIYRDKIPTTLKDSQYDILDLISAGDDYELLFSAKKSNERKILQIAKKLKIKITAIGFFKNSTKLDVELFDSNNKKINFTKYGYRH